MAALDRCYNIDDLRNVAKKRLPKGIFDYIDLGTEDGVALNENRNGFDRLRLKTQFMVDLSDYDWSVDLLGERVALPIGIAPTGIGGLCWHQGDLAVARAAAKSGIPFTLSTHAITPMETIAEVGGRLWFQLYMWDEVDLSYQMVERARNLGYEALVVTIDSALGRLREHNERNGFAFPFKPNPRALLDMSRHPRWLTTVLLRSVLSSGVPVNANFPKQYQRMITRTHAPKPSPHVSMTWDDIKKLRDFWPRKLIVKSILSAEDAQRAVDSGADAIVVSNHGGRSMDSAVSTISVLPEIVSRVGSKTTIIFDSGIKRGSDVVKALAIGADFVLIGRASLYGVAAGGESGAKAAIDILATEFEKTMGYLGCRTVAELSADVFARPIQPWELEG